MPTFNHSFLLLLIVHAMAALNEVIPNNARIQYGILLYVCSTQFQNLRVPLAF